jgi:hypothetical protein
LRDRRKEWVQRGDAENAERSAEKQTQGCRGKRRERSREKITEEAESGKQREKGKDWIVRGSRERRGKESPSLAEWDGKPGKKNAPTNGGMAA